MLNDDYYSHLQLHEWLEKLQLVDPPIHEANARICSDYFVKTCYVSSVLKGFGPSRRTLKPDTVPTVLAFNSPPKCRTLSEARLAGVEHKAVVGELLGEKEPNSNEAEFLKPVTTQDTGIQCGKIT